MLLQNVFFLSSSLFSAGDHREVTRNKVFTKPFHPDDLVLFYLIGGEYHIPLVEDYNVK